MFHSKALFLTSTENRVSLESRCSLIEEERWGKAVGACDDPPKALQKVISKGLWKATHDYTIPEAIRSPAYEFAQLFTLDTLQLSGMFKYRKKYSDPRHAVCAWAVDNRELIEGLLPPGYPRQIQEASPKYSLYFAALSMGCLACLVVSGTAVSVYRNRQNRIIKSAQVEFLALLLLGLFFVAVGSIVLAVPVTTGSCISAIWMLLVGYTIELVPLLVKISAINLLVNAARGHRRVVLQQRHLFTTVAAISVCVGVYLVVWTVLDPPLPKSGFIFSTTAASNEQGEVVLETAAFCASRSDAWRYAAIAWNCTLLLSGSVLAFQSRKVTMKDFNESTVVGLMVYSQSLFLIARIISGTVLTGHVTESALSYSESIIFSTDVIVTTFIYFLPKFKKHVPKTTTSYLDIISTSVLHKVSIGERNILPLGNSSVEFECASISSFDNLVHCNGIHSKAKLHYSVTQCPRCGYSPLGQKEVILESLDEGYDKNNNNCSIPLEMESASSELTLRRHGGQCSTINSHSVQVDSQTDALEESGEIIAAVEENGARCISPTAKAELGTSNLHMSARQPH
jgi:hypothetical protein